MSFSVSESMESSKSGTDGNTDDRDALSSSFLDVLEAMEQGFKETSSHLTSDQQSDTCWGIQKFETWTIVFFECTPQALAIATIPETEKEQRNDDRSCATTTIMKALTFPFQALDIFNWMAHFVCAQKRIGCPMGSFSHGKKY